MDWQDVDTERHKNMQLEQKCLNHNTYYVYGKGRVCVINGKTIVAKI